MLPAALLSGVQHEDAFAGVDEQHEDLEAVACLLSLEQQLAGFFESLPEQQPPVLGVSAAPHHLRAVLENVSLLNRDTAPIAAATPAATFKLRSFISIAAW